jgi:hypothetical protein
MLKKFRIYIDVLANDEGDAFSQADEMVNQAINEESTIQNTFAIEETK